MSVLISEYLEKNSNWVSKVLQLLFEGTVLLNTDMVDFLPVAGYIRVSVDVYHSLSCYDLRKISILLGDRYWTILPSFKHNAISFYFYIREDELRNVTMF